MPSVKGVLPGDDVCAVPAHEELDAVVEGVQVLLGYGGLRLLDDVQRIRGAQAQRVDVTEGLEAAVRVHAVHQAISIIVFAVPTGGFHGCVTSGSSPAQLADTVPPIQVQGTSAIAIAQARTALNGAVFTVPAGAAFTLAIPAGPMFCAARVAGPLVACGPHPAILTAAGASYADAVATAVSRTDLNGAVVSSPVWVAVAKPGVWEESSMA